MTAPNPNDICDRCAHLRWCHLTAGVPYALPVQAVPCRASPGTVCDDFTNAAAEKAYAERATHQILSTLNSLVVAMNATAERVDMLHLRIRDLEAQLATKGANRDPTTTH